MRIKNIFVIALAILCQSYSTCEAACSPSPLVEQPTEKCSGGCNAFTRIMQIEDIVRLQGSVVETVTCTHSRCIQDFKKREDAVTALEARLQDMDQKMRWLCEQMKLLQEADRQKSKRIETLDAFMRDASSHSSIGFPDMKRGIKKPWNTDQCADINGWLYAHTIDDWDSAVHLFVNGTAVFISHCSRNRETLFHPIMKGQTYKMTGGKEVFELVFYPCI